MKRSQSLKNKLVHCCMFLIPLLIMISSQIIPVAAQTSTPVNVFPESLSFSFLSGDSAKESKQKIYLSADSDIDIIGYNFTDLRSSVDTIDGKVLMLESPAFKLTNTTVTAVTATINLTGSSHDPGVYKGRLMLLASDSSIIRIDTEVQIKDLLVESNIMTIDPKSVTFHFDADDAISDVKHIEITTIRNLANVSTLFVDFVPKEVGEPIPENAFTLKPDVFDVITSKPTSVALTIRSTTEIRPGTYEGYLKLSSDNVIQRLPITVMIDKPDKLGSRWEPIVVAIIGITVGVILLLLKEGYKIKEEVRQAFNKAWIALYDASTTPPTKSAPIVGRRDFRFAQGHQSIVDGAIKLLEDDFHDARDLFIDAKEKLDKATKEEPQTPIIPDPRLRDEVDKRLKGLLSLSAAFSKERLLMVIFGIVVATASLTVLSGISKEFNILDFDNWFADGIAAFIFGFASQALVNQIAPIISRKF